MKFSSVQNWVSSFRSLAISNSGGVKGPKPPAEPIRALVFTTHHRNADNWLELFQKINDSSGDCQLVSLRWTADPSHTRISELGLQSLVDFDIQHLNPSGISLARLEDVVVEMLTWEPDVIFLADVQSYPSNAVYKIVKKHNAKTICIGLQHGFYQAWHTYNDNFCADYLFLFGDRHVREIAPQYRERCFPVGLCKLDRLKGLDTQSQGYIFYIPQRFPDRAQTALLLDRLSDATKLPVQTNFHPQFGGLPNSNASDRPFLDIAARAEWVVSSYSTGGIEAMYLGKQVVLLPSHGTTAWHGYPAIARELTVQEVLLAKGLISRFPDAIENFLEDSVGGRRFDHMERAWSALNFVCR